MGTLHRTDVVSYVGARTSPPTPGTPRCSDLTAYAKNSSVLGHRQQRQGLHAPWCSDIASDAGDSSLLGARSSPETPGTPRSSVLGHRQRRRGLLTPWCSVIASDTGDSSLLDARTSPVTPGTPRSSVLGHRQQRRGLLSAPLVVRSCCVSSVCYQAAPCCSDQGADLGQHVWGLDTRMSDDVGKAFRLLFL